MEKLKRERGIARRLFTRAANQFEENLKNNGDLTTLQIAYRILKGKSEELFQIDEKVRDFWLQLDEEVYDEEAFMTEIESSEELKSRWLKLDIEYDKIVSPHNIYPLVQSVRSNSNQCQDNQYLSPRSNASTGNEDHSHTKKHFRLPKLELIKFDGNVKNWLKFWGQFSKIHTDLCIDDDDKFQYLLQATEPGTKARELVESFPPSGANYYKAIEQLKSRFARKEIMVENYIRELINMVIFQYKNKSTDLSSLYDKLTTQIRALETLEVTDHMYAAMLYPLVESAVPEEILRTWERTRSEGKEHVLSEFLLFLQKEVESEERIEIAKKFVSDSAPGLLKQSTTSSLVAETRKLPDGETNYSKKDKPCIFCDKLSHTNVECFKIAKMSIDEKKDIIKRKKGCFVCLKVGHNAKVCKAFPKCILCYKRHVVVMCPQLEENIRTKSEVKQVKEEVMLCHKTMSTLLQTIFVNIMHDNKHVEVRALIDSGSQRSYLTKKIAIKLGLRCIGNENVCHSLFGGVQTSLEQHNTYNIHVSSLDNNFSLNMDVLDKTIICGDLPSLNDDLVIAKLNKANIFISDCRSFKTNCIDLLIGADYSGFLFTGDIFQVDNNLVAMETKLGWILQGKINTCAATAVTSTISLANISELWELEVIGIKDPVYTKKSFALEEELMKFYLDTVTINSEGRYEVKLPWKESVSLTNNKELAYKRLLSTTRRLLNTNIYNEYDTALQEWLQCGIIEKVIEDDNGHFLCHHAVVRESSLTTRVRPVFDASAKDKNGFSLNTNLEQGINLLEMIPNLLVGFRLHEYGVTSDIKKAFLQISVAECDRKYLQFLWWDNEDRQKIITLRHCRVVFGINCSPFLLAATINYHLDNAPTDLKDCASKLKRSFYVDNCITSCTSASDTEMFVNQSKELMALAKMDLRGWIIGPSEEVITTSILGLEWNTKHDNLKINMKQLIYRGDVITKRLLLSYAQRLFDPIGFTCPVSLIPKLLLQEVWKLNIGWDFELPAKIKTQFRQWLNELDILKKVSIPRRITSDPITKCKLSLHTFCDASKNAYAACIFLRSEYNNRVTVTLMAAKSRVAPVKKQIENISIPRLELLAAVIGVRLYKNIQKSLISLQYQSYFWSDSSVVLTWIKTDGDWGVFVKNRVKEIRNETETSNWYHINGIHNPADLPSRGANAVMFFESQWWSGPAWLYMKEHSWPISEVSYNCIPIETELNLANTTRYVFSMDLMYFSSYRSIVRMVGWMFRFINACRVNGTRRGINTLSVEEIEKAEMLLLKIIQREYYGDNKSYKNLVTFVDSEGLIRVKTRLLSDEVTINFQYPILLPGKHLIVRRLVSGMHKELYHAGNQTLIANVRQNYWIIGIRVLVKKVSKDCVICRRYNARPCTTPLAPLPLDRTKNAKPFEVTGVDLGGPLYLRSGEKCWFVLFTCAIYRAVHLDLTLSLSTEDFLLSLRRFIARRGRISIIYSDNGTNFVGAKNLLDNIKWEEVDKYMTIEKITWKLIPPASPWWGGWWERMIKIVKDLLKRTIGKASLNYIELQTILYECEAIINSRPITAIVDDDDIPSEPLTPSLFLQPLSSSNVCDLDHIDSNSLNVRLRYLEKLRKDIRQRFVNEYLALLVMRGSDKCQELIVGDIVLVETPHKRQSWPLAVIVELIKGVDGFNRLARIRTKTGEILRPVKKLYSLELSHRTELSSLKVKPSIHTPQSTYEPPKESVTRSGRVVRAPKLV